MSNNLLPQALVDVIEELGSLPGVGARTAESYAYHLLRAKQESNERLSESIDNLHDNVSFCPVTFALIDADEDLSPLYTDPTRNKKIIAVVEEPLDIIAIERTGQYQGVYHVLGGALSPIDGVGPEKLHISELLSRIKSDDIEELIIATNASVEGESTSLYLQRQIEESNLNIKMSPLARGLPVGVDLEYAYQITLSHALEGRRLL